MFYQCSRIQLNPQIHIKSHTQPTENIRKVNKSSPKNLSPSNKGNFRVLLKSLTDKREEKVLTQKSSSIEKKRKSIGCKYVFKNEKSLFMKKRKNSIIKQIGLKKEKKTSNLHLLERLLTIQPTNCLKKDYLKKCYDNHLEHLSIMMKKNKNSFKPQRLPKIKNRQQHSSFI